jgi:hypothetical protein
VLNQTLKKLTAQIRKNYYFVNPKGREMTQELDKQIAKVRKRSPFD